MNIEWVNQQEVLESIVDFVCYLAFGKQMFHKLNEFVMMNRGKTVLSDFVGAGKCILTPVNL